MPLIQEPTVMVGDSSSTRTIEDTAQEVKTRDPRLTDAQANVVAITYFAQVCGTPVEGWCESLGDVLKRLENNQYALVERCKALQARVDELERRRKQLVADCTRA